VDDTVGEIFGVLEDALAVLVNLLVEERVARVIVVFCREWRSTAKHGIVAGLGGGHAIAWKATVASVNDTVDEIFGVLGDALAVLVNLLVEERVARVIVVFWWEWRSTTKYGGVDGLGGGRAIAWKATGVS